MKSASVIARQLISRFDTNEGDVLTDMKLQKLLYYAQGWSMALLGGKLFPEPVEAWLHGPVVHSVWSEYKCFGNGAIVLECHDAVDESPLLDSVVEVYGARMTKQLRDQTHREAPWRDSYFDGAFRVVINDDLLQGYFTSERDKPGERMHKEFLDAWIMRRYEVVSIPGKPSDPALRNSLMQELGIAQ